MNDVTGNQPVIDCVTRRLDTLPFLKDWPEAVHAPPHRNRLP